MVKGAIYAPKRNLHNLWIIFIRVNPQLARHSLARRLVHPRLRYSIRVHSWFSGVTDRLLLALQAGRIQQILDLLVIHVFLGHGNGAGV